MSNGAGARVPLGVLVDVKQMRGTDYYTSLEYNEYVVQKAAQISVRYVVEWTDTATVSDSADDATEQSDDDEVSMDSDDS
jgi:hypothetical protein